MPRETYDLHPALGLIEIRNAGCPWAILKWTPRARAQAQDRRELAELTTPFVPYYCTTEESRSPQ